VAAGERIDRIAKALPEVSFVDLPPAWRRRTPRKKMLPASSEVRLPRAHFLVRALVAAYLWR
jgi:hypothetical protein